MGPPEESREHVERISISRWVALALNGPPIALLLSAAYAAISLGVRDALIPMLFFYFFLQASVLFLLNRYGVMTLRISGGVVRVSYAGGELRIPAGAVEAARVVRVSALRVSMFFTRPFGRTLTFVMRGGPAIRLRLVEPTRTPVGEVEEILISTTRPENALKALEINGFPVRRVSRPPIDNLGERLSFPAVGRGYFPRTSPSAVFIPSSLVISATISSSSRSSSKSWFES